MKNIIFVLVLLGFCFSLSAQENYKGKVSFTFNEEKIELPINLVSLRKENKVLITIRAEQNNEEAQQLFSLEWEFEKLSNNDKDLSMYDAFLLNVVNNKGDDKDELLCRFTNNAKDGGIVVKKGKRTLNILSFRMKFNIESVSFENSSINIRGNLGFKARDSKSETPLEPVSEIKDCKFEIVI